MIERVSILDGPWPPWPLVFLSFIIQWEPETHTLHLPQSWQLPPGHPPLLLCPHFMVLMNSHLSTGGPILRPMFRESLDRVAAVCLCQGESGRDVVSVGWVLCLFVVFVLCFGKLEIDLRATQRPHKYSTAALYPFSLYSFLSFFFSFFL